MDKFLTKNFQETQQIGFDVARQILTRGPQSKAVVLALRGDLGAGKTTFLQGFARGLGITEVVNSPTFVIMKKFALTDKNFSHFYHFDLYRLENEKEVDFFNLPEIINNSKNIIAIEWPEKMGTSLPKESINISFQHLQNDERELTIER